MEYETRVGMGYDVHALILHDKATVAAKRSVRLCGVDVPHSGYLKGHSDADVGLHALVDALLGAVAEGDIGMHFPPNDPNWHNADSSRFVAYTVELLKQKAAGIVNVDITLICEAPRISPYRDAMRECVATLLNVDSGRVSIKATTTEKLGFLGRGEGIAAQAVAAVKIAAVV
jgi:2-C-methyl-D-erythritol 4-phosphate cytidylyltransferase/2-C-methyl-D-erythritol 2,4-cyclodiphosphate synthase